MTEPLNNSSPSLVTVACRIRADFSRQSKFSIPLKSQKVIIKADEVARIYYLYREEIVQSEIDVLCELLREFGIIASHIPPNFHVDVTNVIKFLEKRDRTLTKSHVVGLIFSRM